MNLPLHKDGHTLELICSQGVIFATCILSKPILAESGPPAESNIAPGRVGQYEQSLH